MRMGEKVDFGAFGAAHPFHAMKGRPAACRPRVLRPSDNGNLRGHPSDSPRMGFAPATPAGAHEARVLWYCSSGVAAASISDVGATSGFAARLSEVSRDRQETAQRELRLALWA